MWKKERGASLLIVSIVVTLLLLLSATFLTTISKQNRMIVSQERLSKSYYVSETGIHRSFNYVLENIDNILESPPPTAETTKNKNGKGNENGNNNSNSSNGSKNNNGNGFGKCNNRGKSITHNPHCKPNSDDPLNSEEDYTILHKSIEILFEEVYTEEAEVSWEVVKIEPNVFLVTSIGYYGQAKTTLSCEFEVTSDNRILVHYLIEL